MHQRRGGRPKIASLLARPDAAQLREELKLARSLAVAPSRLRGRLRVTTYVYDDPANPGRVTSTIESPDWTDDDRALLLALAMWERGLCPGPCGQPIAEAWHTDNDGWYEHTSYHCYACSAIQGDDVAYDTVVSTRPADQPLSPFDLETTTHSPDS